MDRTTQEVAGSSPASSIEAQPTALLRKLDSLERSRYG
jgi:hypothetical protein